MSHSIVSVWRKRRLLAGLSMVAWATFCCGSVSADTPLLSDNFNDNSIDGTKWNVFTANIPAGAAVVEQNQQIEFTGRGHLTSVMQFEPTAQPEHGLRITGQWTLVSNDDFIQILTRTTGTPNPGNCCGETLDGIEFQVGAAGVGGNMTIFNRGGATITGLSNNGVLNAAAGETYNFEIWDTGTNLYFSMSQVGGAGKQRTVVATSTTNLTNDRITFHNREGANQRANLDNVVVDSPSFLGPSDPANFPILLQDNFDNNSLDGTKWNVVTTNVPAGAGFAEANSRAQITGRAHLVTAQQFNPTDGGLRLEGRWTFDGDDFMQILTRSDGTPDPGNCCGETKNGIEFFAFEGGDVMQITQRVNGVTTNLANGSVSILPGDVFDFLITDNGTNLLFQLTQVGGDGTTAQLVGASSQSYAQNFLVFHNREGSGNTAFLDDVVVSRLTAIPEPQGIALWSLIGAVLGAFAYGRRRQRK